MKIHHIGYLVDDISNASLEFEKIGFLQTSEIMHDASRMVDILFMHNSSHTIELIQSTSEKSAVHGLRKRYRNSPYHICYEANNLQSQIDALISIGNETGGYTLLQAPAPAPAIAGCPDVAFLFNKHIGIIELVETKI